MQQSSETGRAEAMPRREPGVVFVDDEPLVLQGLKRMLHPLRDEWQMHFVNGGREALDLLARHRCEVIFSDMRMPGMDGGELLEQVRQRHPHMVRIALSGQASPDSIAHAVAPVHQFLSKPCDAETLRRTLARARTLSSLLAVERLRHLTSELEALPSLDSAYTELLSALRSQEPSVKLVAEAISSDIGMTAKVLQLVNSAFFGLPRRISSPTEAVVLLGLETVKALVFAAGVFTVYDHGIHRQALPLRALRNHSAAVGSSARTIAQYEAIDRSASDSAFVGGFLHDVGKVVLAAKLPEEYRRVVVFARENNVPVVDAELSLIGATHAEVGAYLLGLWGFSEAVVTAVAYHHRPAESRITRLDPLTIVHVADSFEHEVGCATLPGAAPPLDAGYLEKIGVAGRLNGWRDACRRPMPREQEV